MPTWAKMIPYLRMENLKNHTLTRGTYLYIAHIWELSLGNRGTVWIFVGTTYSDWSRKTQAESSSHLVTHLAFI